MKVRTKHDTAISWTHLPGTKGCTWNPTDGCACLSPGCANCYAMRFAGRFAKPGERYHGLVTIAKNKRAIWSGKARLDVKKLMKPLSWRAPRTVFVNSMSDLFYEGFTNEEIAAVFGVMAACPHHTFIILTKRARRAREWFGWIAGQHFPTRGEPFDPAHHARQVVQRAAIAALGGRLGSFPVIGDWKWPLPNVWLGVSVEDMDHSHRIDDLLMTPAAVRLLSIEPMLGLIDLVPWLDPTGACDCPPGEEWCKGGCAKNAEWRHTATEEGDECPSDPQIDWVIAGCESGPGARPCEADWLRELRDQCERYRVPFFLKQARYEPPESPVTIGEALFVGHGPGSKAKSRGVIETPYLDGKQHVEFPIGALKEAA